MENVQAQREISLLGFVFATSCMQKDDLYNDSMV